MVPWTAWSFPSIVTVVLPSAEAAEEVGYPVERLVRVKFGPIALGDQRQGTVRQMGRQEMGHLMASVGL